MENSGQVSDYYKIPEALLTFFSFWVHAEKTFLSKIKKLFAMFFTFTFISSLTMDIYFKRKSISEIAGAASFFFMVFSYILKLICFRLKYDKFKILMLGEHELKEGDKLNDSSFLRKSNFITKFYLFVCYFTCFIMPFLSLINKLEFLPTNGWFPWDTHFISGRILVLVFQVCQLCSATTINGSLDMLIMELILAACWQVRMLKNNLRRITDEIAPDDINEKMIDCTKHYLAIIRYVELVEDVFGNGLFFQFLSSGCGMCITGIEIIIMPMGSSGFFTSICFMLIFVIQISAYCWAGEQLITESEDITTSCYNMNWWYASAGSKKAKVVLYLMMERSKKPISIRAGRFFILSAVALAAIFRTSFSYFAVLQSLQTQHEENQL